MGSLKKPLVLVGALVGKAKEPTQKKKPQEITQEAITTKTIELCKMLEAYGGGSQEAAVWACVEISSAGSCGYFETLGILADAMEECRSLREDCEET